MRTLLSSSCYVALKNKQESFFISFIVSYHRISIPIIRRKTKQRRRKLRPSHSTLPSIQTALPLLSLLAEQHFLIFPSIVSGSLEDTYMLYSLRCHSPSPAGGGAVIDSELHSIASIFDHVFRVQYICCHCTVHIARIDVKYNCPLCWLNNTFFPYIWKLEDIRCHPPAGGGAVIDSHVGSH